MLVLTALRSWLDSWRGIGAVERGMARQGLISSSPGMPGNVLHDWDGAFADERHWLRLGADALASGSGRGTGRAA